MIIGIAGKKRAGKDTLAFELEKKLRKKEIFFYTDSFAAPLREFAYNYFPIDLEKEEVYDKLGVSKREFFQRLGADFMRDQVHKDIHIISFELRRQRRWINNTIISDVRFKNEVQYILDNNGILVYVKKKPTIFEQIKSFFFPEHEDTHQSENDIDESLCDLVIEWKHGDENIIEEKVNEVIELYENRLAERLDIGTSVCDVDSTPKGERCKSQCHVSEETYRGFIKGTTEDRKGI